ncbi:DUF58 domain-containing protein [Eikenella sp. S3360]|uniref:DUF58 domain-containing protein n=1 Tax=Eikenella glucosivorans TaxID=2766967 RepID=A0ABS0NB54_9NEIS|nr:DUF58 domain-containing protein [Eikenella glucosivorans]MBH5329516.1 DUF58 domain-containing protein [Eikenella glucosivorans]
MRPSRLLVLLFAALLAVCVAGWLAGYLNEGVGGIVQYVAGGLALLLALGALLDALWQRHPPVPQWERSLPHQFIQGRPHSVEITLMPPGQGLWRRPQTMLVADLFPHNWHTDTPHLLIDTLPGRLSTIRYQITPRLRGRAEFAGIEYWLPSPFGLWQRRHRHALADKVDVLPDFSRILGADLIGLQRWLNLVGVKKLPRLGLGQDFHQLRDYQDGDDIRNIDWKATSRMSRPIVRTYQDEQDQQLIFLLDCGRNMRLQMEGKSHFDHALQAMLLLSYTALKHGDAVGLLTFAQPEARFVPPHKGMEQLGRLVQGVFDIEPSQQAADFESAVNLLLQKQKRRALVVVLSHLNHEDSRHLLQHIQRLRKHHMVLFGGLRPLAPEEVRQQPVRNEEDAQAYLGALQYESHVAEAIRHFDAARINAVNVLPNQLSTELINRYLQLKRRQAW